MLLESSYGGERLRLQSLDHLSLVKVNFNSFSTGLLDILNIHKLSVLKLVNCHNAERLLDAVTASSSRLRLKSFGFIVDHDRRELGHRVNTLANFLQVFKGLETLHVQLGEMGYGGRVIWDNVIQGALNHQTSLKRMILQGNVPPYLSTVTASKCDATIPYMVDGTRLACLEACMRIARLVSISLEKLW